MEKGPSARRHGHGERARSGIVRRDEPHGVRVAGAAYGRGMCRNITILRGLEPPATSEEISAAARQYVRKVSGIQALSAQTSGPFEAAVAEIAAITARLLDELPERKQPPTTVPPLRRADVQARIAERIAAREAHERAHELGLPHEHGDDEDGDGHDGHAREHGAAHAHA